MSYYRQPPHRVYGTGAYFGAPPLSPVVKGLMIATAAVWLVQMILDPLLKKVDLSWYLGIVPPLVFKGWIWQVVTYLFLHSTFNVFHIVMNMLYLYLLGGDLERHWGGRRFLRYYLICGIGAGVVVAVAGKLTGVNIPTIGASGAIYGLLLAYGIVFAERTVLFMLIFPMKARTLSWILFGVAFFSTWDPRGSGVSHVAHLGGMVVGYLYLKRAWRVQDFYREIRWRLRRRRFRVMPPDEDRWIH